ncbi:MAG: hypothetical protein RMJ84_10170 [Sandaracinaceae bacterium]|nr:hypothetical protein [Sandaracinaceae bacterium]
MRRNMRYVERCFAMHAGKSTALFSIQILWHQSGFCTLLRRRGAQKTPRGFSGPWWGLLLMILAMGEGMGNDAFAQDLAALQAELQQYDLRKPGDFEAVEALGKLNDGARGQGAIARISRAYAATDLYVGARLLGDVLAMERLARALGVEGREGIEAWLDSELSQRSGGAIQLAIEEAKATLMGVRGERIKGNLRNEAVLLAQLPTDPRTIREWVKERCDVTQSLSLPPGVTAEEAEEAKRIVWGIRRIDEAIRRGEKGDPLLALLRPLLESARKRLGEVVITDPNFDGLDGVLHIKAGSLAWGYVSRLRVRSDGSVERINPEPTLPTVKEVPLPSNPPGVPRPIQELLNHPDIQQATAGEFLARIDGGISTHILWCVLLTLARSPIVVAAFETQGGRARFEPVREIPPDAVEIRVRPGGYAVKLPRGGKTTELPRLRVDGRWRFDQDGLTRLLPQGVNRVVAPSGLTPALAGIEAFGVASQGGKAFFLVP